MIRYLDYTIKPIESQDFSQAITLEKSDNPFYAWTEEDYTNAVRKGALLPLGTFLNDRLVALLAYVIIIDVVEIHNVVTHPEHRGKGIATRMFTYLISKLKQERYVHTILLEARSSNKTAQRVYEKLGFYPYLSRERYYTNPTEDAILFRYDINTTPLL